MNYGKHVSTKQTPQSEKIIGTDQVPNSAGGFSWAVDDWKRLDRFLILGSEGGSYYASERTLTVENAEAALRCLAVDGLRLVRRVVEISVAGRAPKNDPALFVLALAAKKGDEATRRAAYQALPQVARTGTHLFTFVENAQGFGGWGRGLRDAVAGWYCRPAGDVAYQAVKYRQRNGWSHRDLLRLAHPKAPTMGHQALFAWIAGKPMECEPPDLVRAFQAAQSVETVADLIPIIKAEPKLTWEMIPTQFLGEAKVWEALLPNLPMTAMLRNLARMTANGLLAPMSAAVKTVADRLTDGEALRKARIHPIAVLGALTTYRQGHGARGQLSWEPVSRVVDALDAAFYASFGNVVPTGQRTLLALDVSGSMGMGEIAGMPGLTPRVASAALALITARVEPNHHFVGFSHSLVDLPISPRQRLDDVIRTIERVPMGGTDCALPMVEALRRKLAVDTFAVFTDSETWAGNIHPSQALRQYREKTGLRSKLAVVGMVANEFTIADPDDAGMLDVVGFDTATPQLLSDFASE